MAATNRSKIKKLNAKMAALEMEISERKRQKKKLVKRVQASCDHKNSILEWTHCHDDEYGRFTEYSVIYRKCKKCGLEETVESDNGCYGKEWAAKHKTKFEHLNVESRNELLFDTYAIRQKHSRYEYFEQFNL